MAESDDVTDEDLVDIKLFTHLRDVIKIVGEEKFHIIAYHVLIGNQVQGFYFVTFLRFILLGLISICLSVYLSSCLSNKRGFSE